MYNFCFLLFRGGWKEVPSRTAVEIPKTPLNCSTWATPTPPTSFQPSRNLSNPGLARRFRTRQHSTALNPISHRNAFFTHITMTSIFISLLLLFGIPIAAVTDPKDALINPRGQKVCMQQCGTSALKCPETFVSLTTSRNKYKRENEVC